ncbi:MAG: nicotinate-nucleotide adenylyltransferase [Chloroflexota bacterium]
MTGGPVPVVPGSLGVFGGTFDPIHFAHLAVAQEAAATLGLERVLFVPAGRPPHKPDRIITPAADRMAMIERAIAGNDRFAADRIELDREGPSYTVDTLEMLATRPSVGGPPALTLILSSEAFRDLPTWREPRRILELACLAVAPREGYPAVPASFMDSEFAEFRDRVTYLDGPRMRLSASELRTRAAAGRSLRYLVPDAVAAYIDDHALYRIPRRNVAT